MAAPYSTSIALSCDMNADGSLSEKSKQRTDRGVELYIHGAVQTITLSGGRAQRDLQHTHAHLMKQYAKSVGIEERVILTEETSLDTVGQAVFTKRDIILPRNWERFIVVSHSSHIDRVQMIFGFVYGRDFDILYEAVDDRASDPEVILHEWRSFEAFLETFDGVKPGDNEAIIARLFELHPLYNGLLIR
ncbi:YdcF family protein [Candidatus Woesearchaeota archaeon]|nr:YdcF family protein [Candidatus Woesearchaeota archaeon]